MVAVKGFPRAVYPPDAAPQYTPSSDGSDIEAYKRTVSRAGRWKWQAFDQSFSNAFSHGKPGGNVGESGVAGVQRQGGISPDTGYIGQSTFNLLRSIRIPEGLPNAGQPAMDARSVELINMAWDRFKGTDKPEPPAGTSAQARLAKAISQLGKKESPANSNMQPYGEWYSMNGVPWCAIFATWCDQNGTKPSKSFVKSTYYAYVPYIVMDARAGRRGLTVTSSPKPGDVVCYDWRRDGEYDHVGFFEAWAGGSGSTFTAIEGNTSLTNDSNGGEVMRRTRRVTDQGTVFIRVQEP